MVPPAGLRTGGAGLPVSAEVATTLRALAADAHPRETGGLLLGWWDKPTNLPVVVDVVEVTDPDATGSRWTRDEAGAASALDTVRRSHPDGIGYVGDWHSHPRNAPPSGADLRALKRISRQYDFPVVLLVVRRDGPISTRLALHGRELTPATQAKSGPASPQEAEGIS